MTEENPKLTRATVVYLIDDLGRVCLAQMKKAIHKDAKSIKINEKGDIAQEQIEYSLGVYNGYGGKETEEDKKYAMANGIDDSMLCTAIRELEEESGVKADHHDLKLVGVVNFYLIDKSEYADGKMYEYYKVEGRDIFMNVYFYFLYKWEGVPSESKEMGMPVFYSEKDIPYHIMMPNDKFLLKKALMGEAIDSDVLLFGKDITPIVNWSI